MAAAKPDIWHMADIPKIQFEDKIETKIFTPVYIPTFPGSIAIVWE